MGHAIAEAMAFIRSDAKGTLAILKKLFASFDDRCWPRPSVVKKATPSSPVTPSRCANAENFNVEARLMKPEAS